MSNMKCPFCGKKLQLALNVDGREFYWCENYDCDGVNYGVGNKELWQKLIRTRKALDIAMDALDRMAIYDSICDIIARNAIKRIKELVEQKDAK